MIPSTALFGMSAPLDRQTITTGVSGSPPDRERGYERPGLGSITDGSSNIYGGALVNAFAHDETNSTVSLKIAGVQANSGWDKVSIGGTVLSRAAAAFSTAGGASTWTWSGISGNPFGAAGSVRVCSFT